MDLGKDLLFLGMEILAFGVIGNTNSRPIKTVWSLF